MEMADFILGKQIIVVLSSLLPVHMLSSFMKTLLLFPSQLMDSNYHAYEGHELPA